MTTELLPSHYTHQGVIDALRHLVRDHLLVWRLEVGDLMLQRFYLGNPHAYTDRNPAKEASFVQFARGHAEILAEFGLSERKLRDCILARIVLDTLPPYARETLGFQHLVELTRVADPTTRARLAQSTVGNHWTVAQLQDAIGMARAGLFYDTDPDQPGTQPPPLPPPTVKTLPPGRLATRTEKMVAELDALVQGWTQVHAAQVRPVHKVRMLAAVEQAMARLAALKAGLGA